MGRDTVISLTIARRDHLVRRLEKGDRRIREKEAAGEDVTEWETAWITLLREYEEVCRQLEAESSPVSPADSPARRVEGE